MYFYKVKTINSIMKFDTNGWVSIPLRLNWLHLKISTKMLLFWIGVYMCVCRRKYIVFLKLQLSTRGVSKANENLTNGLKITTHQPKLHKTKRHKYPWIFPYPATLPFPLLQNKKFHLSHTLSVSLAALYHISHLSLAPPSSLSQLQTLTAAT